MLRAEANKDRRESVPRRRLEAGQERSAAGALADALRLARVEGEGAVWSGVAARAPVVALQARVREDPVEEGGGAGGELL